MSDGMKTLLLTREFPPHVYGGAGVHVEYLARELSTLMDVEVRCFGDQDVHDARLRVRGFDHTGRLVGQAPTPLRGALAAAATGVEFAAAPPDAALIHCHTWYTYLGGIVLKLLYGLPLVVTVHSLEPLRPWKREQLGRGYDYSTWVERTAMELADAVIAVSDGTRRDVTSSFDVDPDRVVVIPNGIDTGEYVRDPGTDVLERYDIPADRPYVLFVGRITRQKGVAHLLRAAEQLEPGIGLVLCAGAPDTAEIAAETEGLVAGLTRRRSGVHWIREMLPRRDVIQLYSHAAVFCCPSVYEPFGIINLEAMACGTPVVAGRVGGIPEVVEDGVTGILVPFDAAAEGGGPADGQRFAGDLAAAMNRLIANEGLRRRMGEAGRRRVEDRFSWRAVAETTARLYRSLAGSRPAD